MGTSRITARAFDFGAIRREFGLLDEYPPEALAEARAATDAHAAERVDRTDIEFVTIDPPTSMDLDQAVHIERTASGFVVDYAIADVGAVVVPGSALDREVRRRGQTFYLPDGSVRLHPPELSEGSGSLLPGQIRPAALWRIELDSTGLPIAYSVSRARVRSVARFDYAGVAAAAEAGTLHPSIAALPEVGGLRAALARERGAISLALPDQAVVADGADGKWRLHLEPRTPADDWNAEISLLTGMCAAQLMLDARIGFLRTLPAPEQGAIDSLRHTAAALDVPWPAEEHVGTFLARQDPNAAATLVLMTEATTLLRGAGYAAFDGALPEVTAHSGIGAPYAHVTAPLRRLSDRYTTEVCLAICADRDVPEWARVALPELADVMRGSDSTANKVDRACIDLTEAMLLADRVGQTFEAVVLRAAEPKRPADVFVAEPPVIARCEGAPPEGRSVPVRLKDADPARRSVVFEHHS